MGNTGNIWKKMDNADISVSHIIGFISYRVSQNLIMTFVIYFDTVDI